MKIEDELPLTPITTACLLALADGQLHGYALMKAVEEQSEGRVRPGTGTLYAALRRMMADGLIRETAAPEDATEDARRRYYDLTPLGRRMLRAELARLARLVELGASKGLSRGLRPG